MILELLKRPLSAVADVIYPPRCPLCGDFCKPHGMPCARCDGQIVRLGGDAYVDLPWRVWVGRARSCFAHDGPVKQALWALKYEGMTHPLSFFCSSLASELEGMGRYDLVTSVPMQGWRVVLRGINPGAILAGSVARAMGVPFHRRVLVRTRSVRRQVGLTREERMENVRGAFALRRGCERAVKGRRALIVDDVMTTGATANECARALMKAGARSVDALTLARAL